jgi:O-antigen/teichoic acid export membrane protein
LKKKFLFNLGLLVLLNLLIKPFWVFGIDMKVQNMVGAQEYGLLFSLYNLSFIFNILLDFGITNFNNRHISQNAQSVKVFFPNIVATKFILTALYIFTVLVFAYALGYDKRQLHVLLLLIANQILISFILYIRSNISGLQYYTTDSILSVTDRIIMIIACVASFYGYFIHSKVTIEWFVFIQTISYAINLLIVLIIMFSKTGSIQFEFNRNLSWRIFKDSLPYAILVFLMAVYSRIDSVMLERMLPTGKYYAGIYAQSFRILDSANMLSILFAGLLFPMFSNLIGRKEDIAPLFKLSFHLICVIAVAFTLGCFYYAQPIIQTLYNEGDAYSSNVFSILIICFIPLATINIFGTLLTAGGNLKILNTIAIISVILNILLNFVLIPIYLSIGAAVAGLITQVFVAILQIYTVKRLYPSIFFKIKPVIYFVITSIMVSWLIFEISPSWFIGFISVGVIVSILGIVFRLLPLSELRKVLQLIQK